MIYGLTLENIKQGMVAKRNPIILNALDKADYIENYATGIRRIFDEYAGFEKQPDFYISDNGVIVTLYNRNYHLENDGQNVGQNVGQDVGQNVGQEEIDFKKLIFKLIKEDRKITKKEIAETASVSEKTIERQMKEMPYIKYVGSGYSGHWEIID